MISHPGVAPVMDFDRVNDVLVVEVLNNNSKDDYHGFGSPRDAIMTIVESFGSESVSNLQAGTLYHFHQRLGHLCYDTIMKMARGPVSGITSADTKRVK